VPRSRSSPWSAGLGQQDRQAATSSTAPAPSDDIRVYQPSTRPGTPLPHAWIDDEDGRRRPVKDLVAPGRFLLIAGEDGQAWCEAARQLAAEADIPLDAVRIGHLDGDCHDPRCAWLRHQQIASDGAVLVRPDRFIAWRHPAAASDPGPSSPPRSARSLGADCLLRRGRQVPDRRGYCAALMTSLSPAGPRC
jgi:aromatic ring hydroxylase-like protein